MPALEEYSTHREQIPKAPHKQKPVQKPILTRHPAAWRN
jgi:hypothetical protein